MISNRLVLIFYLSIFSLFKIGTAFAQAPNISYASPQTYTLNTAIIPLTPANTGGIVPPSPYWQATQFAGNNISGSTDGTGTAAKFNKPMGLAIDAAGNLYVADAFNNEIRKITSTGLVTTFAGNRSQGSADGQGASAAFNNPAGLAVDAAGNIYVADAGNNKIRKITSSGLVTTMAGNGAQGYDNGLATAATFNNPTGVAVDATGNVYVADNSNNQIRMITGAGIVSTLSGSITMGDNDGPVQYATFTRPYGIAIDNNGNLYITDSGDNSIRSINPQGFVFTLAGSNTSAGAIDGTGAQARFSNPTGITIDGDGNIYISDAGNNLVRKITNAGTVTTISNISDGPNGIAVNPAGGLYIVTSIINQIQKLTNLGNFSITPTLPAGLLFDVSTGTISGTPIVTSAPVTYTVTAKNASGSGNAPIVISVINNVSLPPKITSFSPLSGPVGTTVTINGQHFNPVAAGNIVYFGATKATVSNGSSTQLTVQVPVGATYQPLSVLNTATDLIGYADQSFITTFPSKNSIAATDFDPKVEFNAGHQPSSVNIADLDGDGKSDIVVSNTGDNTISILRNVSSPGSITSSSFTSVVTLTTGPGPQVCRIGDMDGDGKPDIVVANYSAANSPSGNTISIYLNTSVSGIISFAPKVDLISGTLPWSVAIGDIDGDGKPDIVVANTITNNISVFRNISTKGSITTASFAPKIDIYTGTEPWGLTLGDLDGDGKPEIIYTNYNVGTISIIRNKATPGTIILSSFDQKVDFTVGDDPDYISIGDLDGDGKPDIAVANEFGKSISLLHNISTQGSITTGSFESKTDFYVDFPFGVEIGDIDGDGKPDLAVANFGYNTISVLHNSTAGSGINASSFDPKIDLPANNAASIAIGDLDGDGRPDLVVATDASVTIYRNNSQAVPVTILPPNISYLTPQTYTVNTTITPLVPKNTGSAVPPGVFGQVSTFAGNYLKVSIDGTGSSASFLSPLSIVADKAGNLYVSDQSAGSVRKITPSGVVTTIAGNFSAPNGLAVDAGDNIYVVESNSQLIKKISPSNVVTIFAGSGLPGSMDGLGTAASFNFPTGIAIDASGYLYVTDTGNNTIRKITPAGMVSTLAGNPSNKGSTDGAGAAASFNGPEGIAVDANGNLIVAELLNNLIRKITPSGVVSTVAGNLAGGSNNGIGAAAGFNHPGGTAVDALGNIYVADSGNELIRKITPGGLVSTLAGNGRRDSTDAVGTAAGFNGPIGLAISTDGNLYVADDDNDVIRKISLSGYTINKPLPPGLTFDQTTGIIRGTPTATSPATAYTITAFNADGSSSAIVNITVNANAVPVVKPPDISYQTPQVYFVNIIITPLAPTNKGGAVPASAYGEVTTFAGSGSSGNINGIGANASFGSPVGIAFDASGNLFVSEYTNNDIRKITPAGTVSAFAGSGANGAGNGPGNLATFNAPYQLSFDGTGNIYVADDGNMMVRKITTGATVSLFAGTGAQGSNNGPALSASFYDPFGLTTDAGGNIYVADRGNSTIRKIDVNGQVSTFGVFDGGTTPVNNAGLGYLAIDASGNLYFVDSYQVKEVTAGGAINIIAGSSVPGMVDGKGAAAKFNRLVGIAVDALGNIYVGDTGNNLVRKITPAGLVTTLAGTGGHGATNGISSSASFFAPYGVTVDNTGNFLYVADAGNNLIRKIAITGYSIDKSLPTGLTFDPATGIISGTPAFASPAVTYTITAYNTGGSSTATLSIEIDEITIAFGPLPAKTVCDVDFDPGATSVSPITYTSNNTAVATIVSGKVHIAGPGTTVITASDGTSKVTQTLTVIDSVTPAISISPVSLDDCQGISETYTATIANGGINPVYQWQVNGQNVGTNTPTFTSSSLNNNDKITCILTSNAVCITSATATSNIASFTIDPPVTASVSIVSSATSPICAGTEVVFSATPVTPGNNPTYQWQVNGQNTGANSPTFTSTNLAAGDKVTCILISSDKCLINPNTTSNSISITLSPASACIIVIPNTFTPNGDGINDLWDITALQGYPGCTITIFNRYGTLVYNSIGYPKAWDGTYNGGALPVGTYYYIIDLKNGRKKITGPVTILR